MKPTTLFWCAAAFAACANVSPPSDTETAALAEARQLLAADPDAALRITDDLLAANPELVDARLLAAEGSRLLANQPGRGRADLLLQDAVTQLEKVIDIEPEPAPETWRLLAECRFDLGEFEGAAGAALRAAEGFAARETEAASGNAKAAILLAAQSELRVLVAARQAEIAAGEENDRGFVTPSRETVQMAAVIAERFESVREDYPGEATTQTALLYQWLGQDNAAVEELERGILNHPQENAIHEAYLGWMTRNGQHQAMVGAYSRFLRANTDAVVLRWYHGRALYARGDDLRGQGNFQGAINSYGKARAAFGEYAAMVPSHSDSANQWIALCELSVARAAVEIGDLEGSRKHLFAADAASPLATTYEDGLPRLVDSFGSHYTGVVFAIHLAHAESGERALARTLEFNEAVAERHPDRWGFVYNNAALAARDLGVQRQTAGDAAAAMELWERSYRYYEKAVELSPDDARIVNDCGLMLIYHLDRDFDRARECFDRAIEIGQDQLELMGEDADPRERELLEEAVGDAWQNIAVLMARHQGRPFEEYREFCEKAVQYYPYARREAAAMLRNRGIAESASAAASTGRSVAAAPQGGAAEAFKKVEKEVRQKAEAGDLDGALAQLDKIAKDCKDYAPFQALRGDYNYRLAIAASASGRSGVEFFFQDAVTALTRAVELDSDPVGPRLQLAQAQYQLSDFPAAAKTASALLLHMQSLGGGKAEDLVAAHTVRANAAARAYAAQKAAGEADDELLAQARASFRLLEDKGALDGPLMELWSNTELWAGAPAAAVSVWVRAVRRSPDDQALLGRLVDTAHAQDQLPLAIEALADRTDATALWYLGRARYLLAGREREAQKVDDALKTLDRSIAAFEASMAKNAGFRASCEKWIAMCLGKKGNVAFWNDDLENAEKWLLAAAERWPGGISEDLGMSETTKIGILRVADKHFQQGDLGKVEAIYRAAAAHADSDLDLLNNAGLFARDYGNQLERQGKAEAAMEMYEQSYKAYRRAQQLDPTNVRLRNDCALIAIYHLERDWDEMKRLLESAIEHGEAQLRDNPPASAEDRQNLDEAVGDCYENLALWHIKHSKDGQAAKAAALKSQQHWPGERRPGARRHLRAAEELQQGK